ncbi:MAG: hypothetical protein PPP58_07980 [Natronomonas sp.]
MSKVSIGLRGWRFDEEDVFESDGSLRPLEEIPKDQRKRLIRLHGIIGEPCHGCWLIEMDRAECPAARIVYGEPGSEVLLCPDHEPDFLYWFREDGGSDLVGEEDFDEAFHRWFDSGNRAPEGYGSVTHVDTDPGAVPHPSPDPAEAGDAEAALSELEDEEIDALETDYSDLRK